MSSKKNDPIGAAILDYAVNGGTKDIIVSSEICEDDTIPASYLFRSYDQMPIIEQHALALCTGKVLDIGAGAGTHALYLKEKGLEVDCIELSHGAVQHMSNIGLNAEVQDFYTAEKQYDTHLMLMNGIGIAGRLSNLERTLLHAKTLLTENGKILCDSTDIKYLYTDDDGSLWVDLNTEYYGNFRFQMHYEDQLTDWFDWLYVDFEELEKAANKAGLHAEKIVEDEHHYLAMMTRIN